MLCDPCNATLKAPLYPGSLGANVMRYRAESVLGTSTDTAAIVAYHPVLGTWGASYAGGSTSGTLSFIGDAWPGFNFLNATASIQSYRGTAGCMQVTYPGTELNRSGYVAMGLINGSAIWDSILAVQGGNGTPISVVGVLELLTHTQRMPVDDLECNWVPGFGDQEFGQLNSGTASTTIMKDDFAKANFVVMAVQGTQATTSGVIRVTTTSIVEVNWATGRGLVSNAAHVQTNPTTFTQVIAALQRKDPHWYINAAKKAARLIGVAATGYASGGVVGVASSLMGLNISNKSSRNIA